MEKAKSLAAKPEERCTRLLHPGREMLDSLIEEADSQITEIKRKLIQ